MRRTYFFLTLFSLSLSFAVLPAQTLLWEDFDGGLPPDWINRVVEGNGEVSAGWLHTTAGPSGPIGGDPLDSPTAGNGWMIFDSDLNCNIGGTQDAWLISPPVAAQSAASVHLSFATYYRSFNDRPQIRIGSAVNDLASWTVLEVFPEIEVNQYGGPDPRGNVNPVTLYFDLSPYLAGTEGQRIAFQFLSDQTTLNAGNADTGCAYAWQIDDVALTVENLRPDFEMGIERFAAISPNAVTPLCQVEPLHFLADVTNNGQRTPDSTVLHLSIRDSDGQTLFTDSLVYGPIASDSTAENVFFPNAFLPPMEAKTYVGTYRLEYPGSEADGFPQNNARTFVFQISDSLYSKELIVTRSIAPAADASYAYGNVFYVPNGDGKVIREVSFAVANAEELRGRRATIFVAAWDGTHADPRYLAPEEYETVGLADYTFRGDEGIGRISLAVGTIVDDEAIQLQDSTHYLVGVEYNTNDDVTMEMLVSEEYDYFATIFQTDSLGKPRYNAVLNVANVDAPGVFDLFGFGYDITPSVRMSISPCSPVSVQEVDYQAGQLRVQPNPSQGQFLVDLVDSPASQVSLRVRSLEGRLLHLQQVPRGAALPVRLELGHLPAGAYLLEVSATNQVESIIILKQ